MRAILSIPAIILLLYTGMAGAQNRPVIKASITKNRILLGEPFQLVIESSIPGGSIVRPLKIDTIPHFEFLSPPEMDTIREATGIQIKAVYSLTSFDSGHWVIPSYSLSSNVRSDTLPVDVVFSEFDPTQPYHDIKDVIPVETEGEDKSWWYYVAGGVLLLLVAAVILARRKKKPVPEVATEKDAYAKAMDVLQKLRKNKPSTVEYYSSLVNIFRIYVLKRKGIHSLQKTTHDLVVKIQSLDPDRTKFEALAQSLRMSDFVKFAKFQPSPSDDEEAWQAIKKGIEELEKIN
jgi:LPXTG-motif cell wall-anchored protein